MIRSAEAVPSAGSLKGLVEQSELAHIAAQLFTGTPSHVLQH